MNRLVISKIIVLLFLCSCGFHEQQLTRTDEKSNSVDTTEKNPMKLMFRYARSGDLEKIKELVKNNKLNLNLHDEEQGITLLMTSVFNKQFGVIEYLVDQGVDLTIKSLGERIKPSVDIFGYVNNLNKNKPQVLNDQDVDIITAIIKQEDFDGERLNRLQFDSITYFNFQLIDWLLVKQADPNALNKRKRTTLIEYFKKNGVKNIKRMDFNGKTVCNEQFEQQWNGEDFNNLFKIFKSYMRTKAYNPALEVGSKKRPASLIKEINKQINKKKREDYKVFLSLYNCRESSSVASYDAESDKEAKLTFRSCDNLFHKIESSQRENEQNLCNDKSLACMGTECCFDNSCKI